MQRKYKQTTDSRNPNVNKQFEIQMKTNIQFLVFKCKQKAHLNFKQLIF